MAERHYKSPVDLFKLSIEAVRRNLTLFIFLNTFTFLGTAWQIGDDIKNHVYGGSWSGPFFSDTFFKSGSAYPKIGGGIVAAILIAVAISLAIMILILEVKAAQKQIIKFDEVWTDFKRKWWRIILVEITTALIILIGFIAIIIPGIFLLGRLALAPYVLVAEDVGVFEALERSWNVTRGRMWQVYNVLLLGLALSILGVIPVVGPAISTVLALGYAVVLPLRYFELKNTKSVVAAK